MCGAAVRGMQRRKQRQGAQVGVVLACPGGGLQLRMFVLHYLVENTMPVHRCHHGCKCPPRRGCAASALLLLLPVLLCLESYK